ncbi:MAG: tRNA (adenosine(37)-N6)-threonylcarbamoyltransferase complex dimerization subunit type 1 TsaB [Chloroflexota bacterium]
MLLAIDTATRVLSLALHDGDRVVGELTWQSANYHTVELTPSVAAMLQQAAITPSDLKAVAVAIGPGSYTGLRIGLAVAKGLALAHSIPLIGVPTLDIVVAPIGKEERPLQAVLQAGRSRICTCCYHWQDGKWRSVSDTTITTWEELLSDLKTQTLFVGEIDTVGQNMIRRQKDDAVLLSGASSLRRSGFLAEIGWERFKRNQTDDPASLAPIYLNTL